MIRFYNTLTRKLESFEPLVPGEVRLYTCGPTVYSHAHVGNFRTFMWEDLLRRFLESRGFAVNHVMNITDVDDKIIKAAVERGASLREVTEPYETAFFEDLDSLGILRAREYPRATEHIQEMLDLLEKLRDKGLAYESDGSVYYRIAGFPGYGKLSGKDLAGLQAGASGRMEADEYDKDDVRDFALWKAAQAGEPSWEGPGGPGRPGWHIECSAMSMKHLGDSFDIHTGGVDNIFPHHENEIAQSEGATGVPLARYWLHAAHLVVEGEKMSKSKGNFYTLRDLLAQGHEPRALRYFLLSVHYRQTLDLTQKALAAARQNLQRLDDFAARLDADAAAAADDGEVVAALVQARRRFDESLDDDLNAAGALGAVFQLVRDTNTALDAGKAGPEAVSHGRAMLAGFEKAFGISLSAAEDLPADLAALVQAREKARSNRDFAESDRLRDELAAAGVIVEDTPQGTRWKRTKG